MMSIRQTTLDIKTTQQEKYSDITQLYLLNIIKHKKYLIIIYVLYTIIYLTITMFHLVLIWK
jgi:hypothetical protein